VGVLGCDNGEGGQVGVDIEAKKKVEEGNGEGNYSVIVSGGEICETWSRFYDERELNPRLLI
jgi:hypothetical protein